jgi:hypothetical protein
VEKIKKAARDKIPSGLPFLFQLSCRMNSAEAETIRPNATTLAAFPLSYELSA